MHTALLFVFFKRSYKPKLASSFHFYYNYACIDACSRGILGCRPMMLGPRRHRYIGCSPSSSRSRPALFTTPASGGRTAPATPRSSWMVRGRSRGVMGGQGSTNHLSRSSDDDGPRAASSSPVSGPPCTHPPWRCDSDGSKFDEGEYLDEDASAARSAYDAYWSSSS